MILEQIQHEQFAPKMSKMKRMFEACANKFLLVSGIIAIGAMVVGSRASYHVEGMAGVACLMAMAAMVVTMFFQFKHHNETHKLRWNNYTQYLTDVPQQILINNYHSPEHDNDTKNAIKAFLNTHHKGWSVPEQIIVEDAQEVCVQQRTIQSSLTI